MSATIELTLCVHCNIRLTDQEGRDGFCETCGERILKMQRLDSKPTRPSAVKIVTQDTSVEQTRAELRYEIFCAVIGWTMIALGISCVGLLMLPIDVPASVYLIFGSITLSFCVPLSWYLAKRSLTIRTVGIAIACIVELSLEVLSCFG